MHTERRSPCVLKWRITCRRPVIADVIPLKIMKTLLQTTVVASIAILVFGCAPNERHSDSDLSVNELIDAIYAHRASDDWLVEFESNTESLKPVLDQLGGPLPQELQDYLNQCIPIGGAGAGGRVDFHGLSEIRLEHTQAAPGCDAIAFGFFCIATEGDGSQFAYCIHDQSIYRLKASSLRGGTLESIQQNALAKWPTLAKFLKFVETEEKAMEF